MSQKSRIAGCFAGFLILLAILCTPAWTVKPPYEDLGYGWTHSFGATMTLPAGSDPYLKIIDENGRAHYFQFDVDRYPGVFQERSYVFVATNGDYIWARLDGGWLVFRPATPPLGSTA